MTMVIREPLLHPTSVKSLRPTQMTVGMREVERKRQDWRKREGKDLETFLGSHMIPVIVGPRNERYLIDHHHLALALHDEGFDSVFVTIVADLHKLDEDHFWNMMDFHGWTHPFDTKGRRRSYEDLPRRISELQDDPYRSLAGELRSIGGFAKDSTPYSEFVWADFLRRRIKPKAVKADAAVVAGKVDRGSGFAKIICVGSADGNDRRAWVSLPLSVKCEIIRFRD